MNSKQFGIVFVLVLIVSVMAMFVGRLNGSDSSNASPSPSPTLDPLFQNSSTAPQQQLTPVTQQSNQLYDPSQGLNQQSTNNSNTTLQNPSNQQQVEGAQTSVKQYASAPPVLSASQLQNKKAVIVTNKGTIEFQISPDAPIAASNFIFLADNHFYDGIKFHRVIQGFMDQGGDPYTLVLPLTDSRIGSGGPGYTFKDEPVTGSYTKGIVAMANAGPNTNGSQFFIMRGDLSPDPYTPPSGTSYTIFGKVISGMDVVDTIAVGDVMQSVTIEPIQ